MTSKIRVTLIKHFLGHRGERFYLRQLERLLQLPLTPARRELIRLEKMGLLKQEQEANLKFFRLNEEFEHLEALKNLVGINVEKSPNQNWLLPVVGVVSLVLVILQAGLFYVWTHPIEDQKVLVGAGLPRPYVGQPERAAPTLAADSYVMSSGKTRLESGGFAGGWQ